MSKKNMTELQTSSLQPSSTESSQVALFLPGFLDTLTKDEKILVLCAIISVSILTCAAIVGVVYVCSRTGRRRERPNPPEKVFYPVRYNGAYWQSQSSLDYEKEDKQEENRDEAKNNRGPFVISFTDGYLPRTHLSLSPTLGTRSPYLSVSSAPGTKSCYTRRYRRHGRSSNGIRKRRRRSLPNRSQKMPRTSRDSLNGRNRGIREYYGEPTITIHTSPYDWH